MPKKPHPTTKQQKKLAEGISEGLSITDAGKIAGYADRHSAARAYRTIKIRFHPALEAKGYAVHKVITDIVDKMHEKLEAKETKFFHYQGAVIETREVAAHDTQLRAANDLARFFGITNNGHEDPGQQRVTPKIIVNLGFLGPERAKQVLEDAQKRLGGSGFGQLDVDEGVDED